MVRVPDGELQPPCVAAAGTRGTARALTGTRVKPEAELLHHTEPAAILGGSNVTGGRAGLRRGGSGITPGIGTGTGNGNGIGFRIEAVIWPGNRNRAWDMDPDRNWDWDPDQHRYRYHCQTWDKDRDRE
ncbi:hypothetical protein chiPu_0006701 [Chiloscyllium punctatum]|uniref:Uncharacterized protein n=1 Tax=Chiloscyllium punctatum TaxID=137246 RepID=A0A401SCY0_CHIPU|nr:hypothetical protein [Chiloscyllium punctatum]